MGRYVQVIGLAALSLVLLAPCALHAGVEESSEITKAKHAVETYFAALNNSQLEIVVGLYHKDSVFLPKNAPAARGIDAIRHAYQTLFAKARLNTTHIYHHVAVYGDIAIVESQGHGTLTLLESQKAIPSNNKELFVLRRIDKKWKIDRYMFNDSDKPGT